MCSKRRWTFLIRRLMNNGENRRTRHSVSAFLPPSTTSNERDVVFRFTLSRRVHSLVFFSIVELFSSRAMLSDHVSVVSCRRREKDMQRDAALLAFRMLLLLVVNIFLCIKLNQIDQMTDRLVRNYPSWLTRPSSVILSLFYERTNVSR